MSESVWLSMSNPVLSSLSVLAILIVFAGFMFFYKRRLNRNLVFEREVESFNQSKQEPDWTIFYASQRGRAQALALQTEAALNLAGLEVEVIKLSAIKPADLIGRANCLFITSTFGNGQAPEAARGFERKLKKSTFNLTTMNYAVLALGDKQYDRFCGFGRKLDTWLSAQNANAIQPIIKVSQMDVTSIDDWQQFITQLGGDRSAFKTKM